MAPTVLGCETLTPLSVELCAPQAGLPTVQRSWPGAHRACSLIGQRRNATAQGPGGHSWRGLGWGWDLTPSAPKAHVLTAAGQAASRTRPLCAPDSLLSAPSVVVTLLTITAAHTRRVILRAGHCSKCFARINAFERDTQPREVDAAITLIYRRGNRVTNRLSKPPELRRQDEPPLGARAGRSGPGEFS